jgi:recombination protein RecA
VIGSRTKVKVVKNKVAPPFREAEFDILYGSGISKEGELVDMAAEYNIIEKLGAWYSYNSERIGQGRENARDLLKANPRIAEEVEAKLRAKLSAKPVPDGAIVSETADADEPPNSPPPTAGSKKRS